MREMSEVLRSAFHRAIRREKWRVTRRPGRLDKISGLESSVLGNRRDLTVYLPPGYDGDVLRRYPVLYMQDGQNLFEPDRAFVRGQHWRLREAADESIAGRAARALIIVGIDHAGAGRVDEYTPTRDEKRGVGGRADGYRRMLLEEIKPLVDERYRTMADRASTAIGGSSLGGLVSLHLALRHAGVFSRAVVMSPSVWWGGWAILRELEQFEGAEPPRVWLDIGGREGREAVADVRLLRDRMLAHGWNRTNFRFYEDRRGDHSERAWAARIRMALEFLFPPE